MCTTTRLMMLNEARPPRLRETRFAQERSCEALRVSAVGMFLRIKEEVLIRYLPRIAIPAKRHRRFLLSTSLSLNLLLSSKEMQLCDHAHTQAATPPNPPTSWAYLQMRQSRRRGEVEATSGQPKLQFMVVQQRKWRPSID